MATPRTVLVTGATGYIGGRLVPRLLEAGFRVRCLARDPARLQGRPWLGQAEVAAGDCLRADTLPSALQGVEVAFYLVHSMAGGRDFEQRDVLAARNFAAAAKAAGVQRIIYLGGLGDPDAALSEHLRSRQETGAVLRETGVPVTEFRAPVIVGSGSLSFEIIRYLTERLPVMICPRWLYTRVQPIAIRNVLDYLVAALDTPASAGRIIEIGGVDVLTYGDLLRGYAKARGLKRWLVPVPVLTPRLSSYWVHLVTPVPAAIARPLIQGLRNDVVLRDDTARRLFPQIQPLDYATAVRLALTNLETGHVETAWSDALASSQGDLAPRSLGHARRDHPRTPPTDRGGAGVRRLCRFHAPGRDHRLALSGLGLAPPRSPRPSAGRRGAAPRPARSAGSAGRRCGGLLAGRGRRAESPAAPARRDESARSRLAGIQS